MNPLFNVFNCTGQAMSIAAAIVSTTMLTTTPLHCPHRDATLDDVAAMFNISCDGDCTYDSIVDAIRDRNTPHIYTFGENHIPQPAMFVFADVMLMLAGSAVLACLLVFVDDRLYTYLRANP